MNVSENGEILETLHDPSGKIVYEASSVEEHNGFLYLGGDLTDHISKYSVSK